VPDIHITVSDVERIKSELTRANTAIADALRKVDSAIQSADWKDANASAFAQRYDVTKRRTAQFAADYGELSRTLQRVIDQARAMGLK
jgi:hypothetical protein